MPRARQSRTASAFDVQPIALTPSDAAGSPPLDDLRFDGAEPDALPDEVGFSIVEPVDSFVFFADIVADIETASRPGDGDVESLATDESAGGVADGEPASDMADLFGAATVALQVRISEPAAATSGVTATVESRFSFAEWSAGHAPAQPPLEGLPLQFSATLALQIEALASGIHALDCGAGDPPATGFEALAVDSSAEPVVCACCAFTYGTGEPAPQTDDYSLSGTKWGSTGSMGSFGGTVTWSIVGSGWTNQTGVGFFSGSTVSLSSVFNFDYVAVLNQAFAAWSAVANINFVQVADGGGNLGIGNSAYIRVSAGYIDGNYNVLGRAFYPATAGNAQNYAYSGDMVFDSGEASFWNASSLLAVATHEIGHAIGIGHSSISNALMAPYYNPSITTPQQDDIAAARAIYGTSGSTPPVVPQDDYADNRTDTTAPLGQVAGGGSATGSLETAGDRDWFGIALTAGVNYTFELKGAASNSGTLSDPYLYLYSSAGKLLAFNDDREGSRDSRIVFVAATSGFYYLAAAAYNDASGGTYRIETTVTLPEVYGDDNDNTLVATALREVFIGYGGNDTVSYANHTGTAGVVANLGSPSSNTGFAARDSYVSIENLIGSALADRLTGNSGNNILEGGAGADALDGSNGVDLASYAGASAGVTASLANRSTNTGDAFGDSYRSIEGLIGSAYDDTLIGSKTADTIIGGAGNDVINGGGKADTLTGNAGYDRFVFAKSSEGGDLITDFTVSKDLIGIVRSGFGINTLVDHGAGGALDFASEYFVSNTTGSATVSGHGQFIFDQTTDRLLWDPDGMGRKAAIVVARFATDIDLNASDLYLI
ncbi:MAG: matrixin family metalloprotease [Pseudorhodoplanes sp.]